VTDLYGDCKTAFMAKARTITSHIEHDWQVTDDDSDVNRGADCFMIFRPGSSTMEPYKTKKIIVARWELIFDMQIRYKTYKTSWNLFETFRTAIFNKFVFTETPFLDIPYFEDLIIRADQRPGQSPPDVVVPAWLGTTMTAVITQSIVRIGD